MNTLRVSIIIPVYNEQERITDCLKAIESSLTQPYEVIVVDNNSTDNTAILAKRFKFVTLVNESKQGVAHARDRGFNAARGDILGRIDADTLIPQDWIGNLQELFGDNPKLMAASGTVDYRDVAFPELVSRIDLFWRRRMARLLGRDVALQGANMAVRRLAWNDIKREVCHLPGLHEDFDLAVHLVKRGHHIRFTERLNVSVCYRQAKYDFVDFIKYSMASPNTYLHHRVWAGLYMFQVIVFVAALFPLISLLGRGYNPTTGKLSFKYYWSSREAARPNPAEFID